MTVVPQFLHDNSPPVGFVEMGRSVDSLAASRFDKEFGDAVEGAILGALVLLDADCAFLAKRLL